jgi:hypothetical protein
LGTSFELAEGSYAAGAIQVRQTDVAGNVGPVTDLNPGNELVVDTTAPDAATVALAADTGASSEDFITSNRTVNVTGVEASATWEYSINAGENWIPGVGTSFDLAEGSYAANAIQIRQMDAAGNVSEVSVLNPGNELVVDTTAPAAATVALAADTGASAEDFITSNGTVNVAGVEAGATWEYSTDGGVAWVAGLGTSFELAEGSYAAGAIQVRQTDVAGNVGEVSILNPDEVLVVDTTAPDALGINLAEDTGTLGDFITSNGTVNVTGLEAGATWEYSINAGDNWIPGIGTSFDLAEGSYVANAI